jgi:hypothetical protein
MAVFFGRIAYLHIVVGGDDVNWRDLWAGKAIDQQHTCTNHAEHYAGESIVSLKSFVRQ